MKMVLGDILLFLISNYPWYRALSHSVHPHYLIGHYPSYARYPVSAEAPSKKMPKKSIT